MFEIHVYKPIINLVVEHHLLEKSNLALDFVGCADIKLVLSALL